MRKKQQTKKKNPKSSRIAFDSPRITEVLQMHPEGVEVERMTKIVEEFAAGFHFLHGYGLAETIFGSARANPRSSTYQEAYKLSFQLSKQGFAIITGGGPGIMEAANKGAYDAGGQSAGLNIMLPKGQQMNRYVKDSKAFYYFFIRKVMLAFASEVYIFFPGGFGTLDEMLELTTLVETKKIDPIPIVLVGKAYWQPLLNWFEETLYRKHNAIGKEDMEIHHLVDNAKEALALIQEMVRSNAYERKK